VKKFRNLKQNLHYREKTGGKKIEAPIAYDIPSYLFEYSSTLLGSLLRRKACISTA
jgi:hypothetical protein